MPQARPIDIVLARLTAVREAGARRWGARCPAHDDAAASLSVTEGRDHRVLLVCGAGCEPAAIAGAIGLELYDLFPATPATSAAGNGAGTSAAPRERTSARAPTTPREPATLLANLDAEQAVLAALLIAATDRDDEAVPRARALLQASMFFADKHRRIFRAMERLAEAQVTIDPLTVADALATAGELERVGGKEYVGFLVDAIPTTANVEYHAGIVREWARRRQLLTTVEQAATSLRDVGTDSRDVTELARAVQASIQPLTLDDESDEALPVAIRAIDAGAPEPIEWCVQDLLVAGELALFAGDGGSFKSTGAFHMAAAVAGGYSAFNRFPTRQAPTLIVSAEDGQGVVLNRLDAIVAGHGWDRDRALSNVHVIASHDASLSDPRWQAHILAEAERLKVGFVVCDPLFDLVDGDENSNTDLRPVIKFCRRIATALNAAVVIVHHATKVKEGQRAIDRVRGASAIRDACRCLLFFEWREEGIAIEHLKMSRSEKLPPFMITREIVSTLESKAVWASARFSYQTVHEAILSRAETWVLAQVTASPGMLKTADLRTRGAAVSIYGEDVSKALTHLQARGLIDYDAGARNSKLWRPMGHKSEGSQKCENRENPGFFEPAGRFPEPDDPAGTLSGRLQLVDDRAETRSEPAAPFRGQGQARGSMASEPADRPDPGDVDIVEIPEEFDLPRDP